MSYWQILWESRALFFSGALMTVVLFLLSLAFALFIGVLSVYLTEGEKPSVLRRFWFFVVDVMRTLPFLIFAYLLYYGLPSWGVVLPAFGAGVLALSLYHGCYFAEIFRGARAQLARGQIEAAYAHGFRRFRLVSFIVLPQLFLRQAPVLANQLVYLLKDTAFLSIITLRELTFVSGAVAQTHFMPIQSFLVAIAIYWGLCVLCDALLKVLDKMAIHRGLGHV